MPDLARRAGARGDTPAARRRFAQALALHREIGDRLSEGDTLLWEGELAASVSDLSAAQVCFAGVWGRRIRAGPVEGQSGIIHWRCSSICSSLLV